MDVIYREIMVWKRLNDSTAVRYCCLNDLERKKFAVQSADFFRLPFSESQFRVFEKQFVELLIELAPRDRCDWFDSIEDAVRGHDLYFSESDQNRGQTPKNDDRETE